MKQKLIILCVLPIFVTGCVTTGKMDDRSSSTAISTAVSATVGCAAGALLSHATGQNAAGGCVAGAIMGGLVGYEMARRDELAEARQIQRDAVATLRGAKTGKVVIDNVDVKEKATGQVKQVRVFRAVNVDLPLSKKGTPEYNLAMDKLRKFAEKVADERGKSEIIVSYALPDARIQKISTEAKEFETVSGKGIIRFSRTVDKNLKAGIVRVTVRAINTDQIEI